MKVRKLYGVLLIMTLLLPILFLSGVNQTYAATSKAWTYSGDPTKVQSVAVSKGLQVVNKQNPVPKGYITPSANVAETKRAFAELAAYAKLKKNYTLEGFSWDRTYDYQANLYNNAVKNMGQSVADTQSAKPGFSEHHTGFAVDYNIKGIGCSEMQSSCASKAEYKWVNENAYIYGFILRYTAENSEWTGYNAEYWHLRYIGKAEALKYHTSKAKSLEEYVGMTKGQTLLRLTTTLPVINTIASIKKPAEILNTPAETAVPESTESSVGSSLSVTKDTYTFADSGVLKNKTTGELKESLFTSILKEKESVLLNEAKNMITKQLQSSDFRGGIYTETGSLWSSSYKTSDWKQNTSPTIIYMEGATKAYKIEIPAGDKGTKNQAVIGNAIAAVETYKAMVKETMFTGLLTASYNVYSMTPKKQLLVKDIVEQEKVDGKYTGMYVIKTSGMGSNMDYSLKNFYHPILGKLDSTTLGNSQDTVKEALKKKISEIIIVDSGKETASFEVHSDFTTFYADVKANAGLYSPVSGNSVSTKNGVKNWTTPYSKKEIKPESLVDGSFPLALPSVFTLGDLNYQVKNTKGYDTSRGIYLMLSNATVYEGGGAEARKSIGDFATFGIDLEGLSLNYVYVDGEGNPTSDTENGIKLGVLIPLWYKEVIINTLVEGGVASETDKYFTGRSIRFNNDYNKKAVLDSANYDLLSAVTKITGTLGIELRRFSFNMDADPMNRTSHISTGAKPENFRVITDFVTAEDAPHRGVVIYRNNSYVMDDPKLVEWLVSEPAQAMTEVDANFLLKLITGELGEQEGVLTYKDWLRMQEIKAELDTSFKYKVQSSVKIFSIVLGYLIIVYSLFLYLAYWFDIVNSIFEFSLMKVMTGGRLYAVPNKDAIEYISGYAGDNLKYVTYVSTFFIMLIGVFVGLTFINVTPILEFIMWLYYWSTAMSGV